MADSQRMAGTNTYCKAIIPQFKKIAITCSKVKSIAGGWRIGCKIAGDEVISRVWHKIAGGVEIVPR